MAYALGTRVKLVGNPDLIGTVIERVNMVEFRGKPMWQYRVVWDGYEARPNDSPNGVFVEAVLKPEKGIPLMLIGGAAVAGLAIALLTKKK